MFFYLIKNNFAIKNLFVLIGGANSVRIFMQNKSWKTTFGVETLIAIIKMCSHQNRDIINRFVFGDHIFPYLI